MQEAKYIASECRNIFRENQSLSDPALILSKIEEGENRLEIGLHYKIPYPRLHHTPPHIYKPAPVQSEDHVFSSNPKLNEKLKQAMERLLKINIEIEITPEEVPLANEIISTLRQLTSHVSLKQVSIPDRNGTGLYDVAPGMHMLQPGPQVPAPGQVGSVAPGGGVIGGLSVAPSKPQPIGLPTDGSYSISPDMFVPVINRLMDMPALDPGAAQQCFDQVAADIKAIFAHSSSSKEELVSSFLQAFTGIIFSPDLVHRQQPLLPFMELLPMLPESAYSTVRDKLISTVLKHLTIKRTLDADRVEFFAYAEAFAALVKLGTVSIPGSITTIITLMNKPENRCAAVTMLGKTCDLCGDLLVEKCSDAELAPLRNAVDIIAADTNGPFQYDVDYIKSIMGWGPGAVGGT